MFTLKKKLRTVERNRDRNARNSLSSTTRELRIIELCIIKEKEREREREGGGGERERLKDRMRERGGEGAESTLRQCVKISLSFLCKKKNKTKNADWCFLLRASPCYCILGHDCMNVWLWK